MEYYKQTKAATWLPTEAGTVWVSTFENYIQPEDESLRTTSLGVDLSLLDDESFCLFKKIETMELPPECKQLK